MVTGPGASTVQACGLETAPSAEVAVTLKSHRLRAAGVQLTVVAVVVAPQKPVVKP